MVPASSKGMLAGCSVVHGSSTLVRNNLPRVTAMSNGSRPAGILDRFNESGKATVEGSKRDRYEHLFVALRPQSKLALARRLQLRRHQTMDHVVLRE